MDIIGFASVIAKPIIGLFITCVVLLYIYFHRTYKYWKNRGIPYAKPLPIVGNLGFIMRRSMWDFCYELKMKHPSDYVGIFLSWTPTLVVQTPELARNILTKDFHNFEDRYLYSGYSDPLGSLNLFTVKNPIWKQMRYELSPMFTALRLKTITELMNINASELVKKIKRDQIDKNIKVNLKDLFSMYTSDTVAYSVFGIRVSILNDSPSPLWNITSHMVKFTFWRGLEFTMIFLTPAIAKLLRLKLFSTAASEYIKELFWTVVDKRQNAAENNKKDLVNRLLKIKHNVKLPDNADPQLADNIMLAQAAVFILGSVETSSTTLSFCLHELAYHPEEQVCDMLLRIQIFDFKEKLFNEVNDAVKQTGKDILDYNELLELKYLQSCIFETLRKYPPVPYLDRLCAENYKLNDEVTVEKGVPVFVNVVAIHHNEKYYPKPNEWQPERFISVHEGDNLDYTFLPFGEGPRFCIGKRYGMMQIRASLAQLILKYKILPNVPYSVRTDPYAVILAPEDGLSVRFVPR